MCFPAMNQSLASAMYLPAPVYSSDNLNQILVYQLNNDSIIKNFFTPIEDNNKENNKILPLPLYGDKIKAFGMIDSLLSIETTLMIEELAQMLADTYDNNTKYKDMARKGEIYAIYFWSNIYCACVSLSKMRSVGYKLGDSKDKFTKEELDCLYKSEHYRWNVERLLNGTRVVTEEEQKDVLKKLKEKSIYEHIIEEKMNEVKAIEKNIEKLSKKNGVVTDDEVIKLAIAILNRALKYKENKSNESEKYITDNLLKVTSVITEGECKSVKELLTAVNDCSDVSHKIKNEREKNSRHHLICSFERLKEIDSSSTNKDVALIDCAFEHLEEIINKYCK